MSYALRDVRPRQTESILSRWLQISSCSSAGREDKVALDFDLGRRDNRLIMSGVTLNSHSDSSGEDISVSEPEWPSKSVLALSGEVAVDNGVDAAVATGACAGSGPRW
jgi:hypothetical protein